MTDEEAKAVVSDVVGDLSHIAAMPDAIRGASLFIAKSKLVALLQDWPKRSDSVVGWLRKALCPPKR